MARAMAPKAVTRRDRPVAYFLTGALGLGIIILVLVEIIRIILSRHSPETMTTFLNGAEDRGNMPLWGRMPYFFVRSQKETGTVTCPDMSDVQYADTGLGEWAHDTFKKLSEPWCDNIGEGMARVNFTMLVPLFRSGFGGRGDNVFKFPHPPTIDIRFAVKETDGVDLFFAEASAPCDAVSPPWRDSDEWMSYIGGIGDLSETQGQYVHTHVTKGFQPRKGVFWGFTLGDAHVEETMDVTYSGYHPKKVPLFTKSNASGVNFGWRITVSSSVLMERRPISIVMQIFRLLSKVGGWMTIATAVFYLFFVNKYPLSQEEAISQRLALRWRRASNRDFATESGVELNRALYDSDSRIGDDLFTVASTTSNPRDDASTRGTD